MTHIKIDDAGDEDGEYINLDNSTGNITEYSVNGINGYLENVDGAFIDFSYVKDGKFVEIQSESENISFEDIVVK